MLKTRVIPCLLLSHQGLVKTIRFKHPRYVGDPINTARIFNEKEVHELIFLDIDATVEKKKPSFDMISRIASECFIPFVYGGGIRSIEDMKKLYRLGVEKISINSYAAENPFFIRKCADEFGSQSIVVSIDVKKTFLGTHRVYTHGGRKGTGLDPEHFAIEMEKMGAGEIFLTSIDRDGTWEGYDIDLIKKVSGAVHIPVIACGGAGRIEDFSDAIKLGGASAVASGSMFVYQAKNRGVLINFPSQEELEKVSD